MGRRAAGIAGQRRTQPISWSRRAGDRQRALPAQSAGQRGQRCTRDGRAVERRGLRGRSEARRDARGDDARDRRAGHDDRRSRHRLLALLLRRPRGPARLAQLPAAGRRRCRVGRRHPQAMRRSRPAAQPARPRQKQDGADHPRRVPGRPVRRALSATAKGHEPIRRSGRHAARIRHRPGARGRRAAGQQATACTPSIWFASCRSGACASRMRSRGCA